MTTKVENNEKNRMALAEQVVDSMDMKTLTQMVYEHILEGYEKDDEFFERDWEMMNE
tara:strand:- start:16 stop:186 length:171 start_codon:yes stop_codon:yes gene_type:complete